MDNNLINFASGALLQTGNVPKPGPVMLPIDFPRKKLTDETHSTYHVYKDSKEFVTVQAATAAEAMEKSEVKNPKKIVRTNIDLGNFIDTKIIVEETPEAPPATETLPTDATAAPAPANTEPVAPKVEEKAAPAAVAEEKPLSPAPASPPQ